MPHASPPTAARQTDLRRLVAGLFMVGWDGPKLSPEVAALLRQGVRGVSLFAKNIRDAEQTRRLCVEVAAERGPGVLIGVDQEGGSVARLRDGCYVTPPLRRLGEIDDPAFAHDVGRMLGLQLRSMGIHLNFAPVLDVDTNPQNPVIGVRSLGRDPARVGALGSALVQGMQSAAVAACGKHFPGHGDTLQDSHHHLPHLPHDLARLESVELPPFRAAIDAGLAAVMTAHIVFDAVDPDAPATMSRPVVSRLLRKTLGFDGVVISDDLEMKAIAHHFAIEDVAVRAIDACVDLLLICHHPALAARAIEAVVSAVEGGRLDEQTVWESSARVDAMAQRFATRDDNADGWRAELATLEARVRDRFAALDADAANLATGNDPTDYQRSDATR